MALRAMSLSKDRAGEIRKLLVEKYSIDVKRIETVGRGWDIVATGKVPADLLAQAQQGAGNTDVFALLGTIGKQVHGSFGTGYVITTSVGTALITEDGKIAVGAVPEQVVTEAIKTVK